MSEVDSIQARRTAVSLATSRFGPDHRETLKARNLLGFALHRAGMLEEAERELRTTKEDRARALGPADTETLFGQSLLAYLLFDSGNLPEAVTQQRMLVEASAAALGERHPITTSCHSSLETIRGNS
ncbi:hypothetical protein DMH03_25785 [Amycolatopsis sp. WAC 01376]|uniref:tetratricopeptide repeat protein n=1 Tax=Amycolatopsis sp. WAC 01376 TaxID=2203195 RepID=UPI000F79F15F|nr:tetratricopeptide repeat protein [Amycolatopsis sp. WAC 01376]RSM59264.1 hypothetical protein DMH03_25785 [Amycolatopsis sp. WAC 01376]